MKLNIYEKEIFISMDRIFAQFASFWNRDHTVVTVTRSNPNNSYLHPIPQGQLDGMEGTDADKAAYQNPGY